MYGILRYAKTAVYYLTLCLSTVYALFLGGQS